MLRDNSQLKLSLSPYQGIYEVIIPANHLLRRIKENIEFSTIFASYVRCGRPDYRWAVFGYLRAVRCSLRQSVFWHDYYGHYGVDCLCGRLHWWWKAG